MNHTGTGGWDWWLELQFGPDLPSDLCFNIFLLMPVTDQQQLEVPGSPECSLCIILTELQPLGWGRERGDTQLCCLASMLAS